MSGSIKGHVRAGGSIKGPRDFRDSRDSRDSRDPRDGEMEKIETLKEICARVGDAVSSGRSDEEGVGEAVLMKRLQ